MSNPAARQADDGQYDLKSLSVLIWSRLVGLLGVTVPLQVCGVSVSSSLPGTLQRGPLGWSGRKGRTAWLWSSWQRAHQRDCFGGVGGSGSWISATALPYCTWYFYTNTDLGCNSAQPKQHCYRLLFLYENEWQFCDVTTSGPDLLSCYLLADR